jgi:SAM-dependent methyltransferase
VTPGRKPATAADFEAKYQQDEDPWGYRDSWYEQRKYAVTMACLPRPRYRLVWEPACSIGVLTGLLAQRADQVLASDGSAGAIATARAAHRPDDATGRIDWSVQILPSEPPCAPGSADLVMLSEILYYLPEPDRITVLDTAASVLAPGGDLVVVHWRPLPHDAHLSGDDANAWVRARPGWSVQARHDDEEFVLDVLRRS